MDNNVKLVKLEGKVESARQRLETAEKNLAENPNRKSDRYFASLVESARTKHVDAENELGAFRTQIEAEKINQKNAAKKNEEIAEKLVEPTKDFGIRKHDYVGDWYALYDGIWRRVILTELKGYLIVEHQISDEREEGFPSPAEMVIQNTIKHFSVDYAGNFAGYLHAGEYPTPTGGTLLITRGRKLLEAKKGDHRFVGGFLKGCFSRPDQFEAFCGWMLAADISLHQPVGSWNHGQALLLVGEMGKGKSAFQVDFIDAMLTNHHADATCFLKGESTFNAQLGEAEHWLMGDPKSSSQKEKDNYISGVKAAIANVWMFIHPKGKTPIDLPTYRRLTISLNEEESALSIVSDLEPSELEKILALNFENAGKYAPNGEGGLPYAEWKVKIQSQLPAFKWWLHNDFVLSENLKHPRYGVQYTNPDLVKTMAAPSQKERDEDLEGMLLGCCFEVQTKVANTQRMEWSAQDYIELTAAEVTDRLLGLRNPAQKRAMKMPETKITRRMTAWLTRLCNEKNGQRNGFHMERYEPKVDHVSFRFNKTFRASNNGNAVGTQSGESSSNLPTAGNLGAYLAKLQTHKDL